MVFINFYLFFIFGFMLIPNYAKDECILPIDTNTQISTQPLYFVGTDGKYELAIPNMTDGQLSIIVNHSNKIKLACSTSLTSVNTYDYTYEGKCKDGKLRWQNLQGNPVGENCPKTECKIPHRFTIRHTQKPCYNKQGKIYEIGILHKLQNTNENSFKILIQKSKGDLPTWYPMVTVCYDENNFQTKYTKHSLYGESIQFQQKITTWTNYDYNLRQISNNFNRALKKQYENSESIQAHDTEYEDGETKLYVQKQLVPVGDMLLLNWYPSTYSHMNIIPMWNYISCTWYILEDKIRKTAALTKTTLTVYTGSFAPRRFVYQPDEEPRAPLFYFAISQNSLRALSYWKILINESTGEGIGFLLQNTLHNDMFFKGDIDCASYEWIFNESIAFTGVVSCWSISYFTQRWNLSEINSLKSTPKVLRGNRDITAI